MDAQAFARLLPEFPPEALRIWAKRTQTEELGEEAYTVFHCERAEEPPELQYLMENITQGKKVWATKCVCTNCGSEWLTRKGAGPNSFFVVEGEDGNTYSADITGYCDGELCYMEVAEGDGLLCPCCGTETRVINRKTIRGGRTKRLQVAELRNIGGYTTIIYWLMEREIGESGTYLGAMPRYAYAIDEKGAVKAFTHRRNGGYATDVPADRWKPWKSNADKWDAQYADWGSINNRKAGSAAWDWIPGEEEMEGTTGEKTGLWGYWNATKGYRPLKYIRLWQKCPGIENLVQSGFGELVSGIIEETHRWSADLLTTAEKYMDITKRRPHEILRLSKEDHRELPKSIAPGQLMIVQMLRSAGERGEVGWLVEQVAGVSVLDITEEMKRYGGDVRKYVRYMEKQGMSLRSISLLKDTREFARRLAGGRELTREELWPRQLRQTHDRLAAQIAVQQDAAKSAKLQGGFDRVMELYRDLQWNDGELAVLLPRGNEDLIREGEVLRHCVGGYGEQHAGGEKIILFIRHYRRPERSYYTLNISFQGNTPRRIQLHGYGNERHGENKQYGHNIPKKVLEFVDRWEREVLRPWWIARQTNKKERTA